MVLFKLGHNFLFGLGIYKKRIGDFYVKRKENIQAAYCYDNMYSSCGFYEI